MVTKFIWITWTLLSAVRERPLNLITHSLTHSLCHPIYERAVYHDLCEFLSTFSFVCRSTSRSTNWVTLSASITSRIVEIAMTTSGCVLTTWILTSGSPPTKRMPTISIIMVSPMTMVPSCTTAKMWVLWANNKRSVRTRFEVVVVRSDEHFSFVTKSMCCILSYVGSHSIWTCMTFVAFIYRISDLNPTSLTLINHNLNIDI